MDVGLCGSVLVFSQAVAYPSSRVCKIKMIRYCALLIEIISINPCNKILNLCSGIRLCDQCDVVQDTANKIWEKVGDKYLEENIQDYKDQVDFPCETPVHYPDDGNILNT